MAIDYSITDPEQLSKALLDQLYGSSWSKPGALNEGAGITATSTNVIDPEKYRTDALAQIQPQLAANETTWWGADQNKELLNNIETQYQAYKDVWDRVPNQMTYGTSTTPGSYGQPLATRFENKSNVTNLFETLRALMGDASRLSPEVRGNAGDLYVANPGIPDEVFKKVLMPAFNKNQERGDINNPRNYNSIVYEMDKADVAPAAAHMREAGYNKSHDTGSWFARDFLQPVGKAIPIAMATILGALSGGGAWTSLPAIIGASTGAAITSGAMSHASDPSGGLGEGIVKFAKGAVPAAVTTAATMGLGNYLGGTPAAIDSAVDTSVNVAKQSAIQEAAALGSSAAPTFESSLPASLIPLDIDYSQGLSSAAMTEDEMKLAALMYKNGIISQPVAGMENYIENVSNTVPALGLSGDTAIGNEQSKPQPKTVFEKMQEFGTNTAKKMAVDTLKDSLKGLMKRGQENQAVRYFNQATQQPEESIVPQASSYINSLVPVQAMMQQSTAYTPSYEDTSTSTGRSTSYDAAQVGDVLSRLMGAGSRYGADTGTGRASRINQYLRNIRSFL